MSNKLRSFIIDAKAVIGEGETITVKGEEVEATSRGAAITKLRNSIGSRFGIRVQGMEVTHVIED